jgi:peptidoglycan/xylan/chitin deacetylase (PgdA/CDA1 family)
MRIKIILAAAIIGLAAAGVTAVVFTVFGELGPTRLLVSLGVMLAAAGVVLVGVFDRRSPVFGGILWRGPARARAISITFDDGPNEPYTSGVLDILKALDVKAAFFMVGENVEAFPDAARRVAEEGHEIGNHGYDHTVLPLRSRAHIRNQIARTTALLERTAGVKPIFFRAPHGWRNPWMNRAARDEGCTPVAWTLGVWDTDRPGADQIVKRTLRGLSNGCILLLHDGRGTEHGTDSGQLVEALPAIIRGAREAGYRIVTLSEMAKEARNR